MPDDDIGRSARPRANAGMVIQAAARLFGQRGYSKTTVAALAAGLGMSPGNVYRFFRSKEELRRAVVGDILDASYAMALHFSRRPAEAASRIRRCLKAQHRMTAGIVTRQRTMHELIVLSLDRDRDLFDSHIARVGDLLATVIADGIGRQEFADRDAHALSRIFIMATAKVWHPKLLSSTACGSSPPGDLIDFALCALKRTVPSTGEGTGL